MRNVMRASGISLCRTGALSSVPNNRSAGRSMCMYLRPLQYTLAIHHRWAGLLELYKVLLRTVCGPKGKPTC